MRRETKALIIVLIMLLSVGPLMSFFGKNEIDIPNTPPGPTFNTYAGNFSAALTSIEPYITYYGIATQNDKQFVESVLKNISDNYTVEVSLNPNGYGYQYVVRIYENDTNKMKELGFKMAFRLADFFAQQNNYPLLVGNAMILRDFNLLIGENNTKAIHILYNQTIRVPVMYSRGLHQDAELHCPEIKTSLNDTLIQISQQSIDAEIARPQNYFGLTIYDINGAAQKKESVQLKVETLKELRVGGSYPETKDPNALDFGFNAHLNGNGTTYYINPILHTFSVKSTNITQATIDRIHTFCNSNGLNISVEYILAETAAPRTVIFDSTTFELRRIPKMPLKVKPGTPANVTVQAEAAYKILYGEVIDASAKEIGLSAGV